MCVADTTPTPQQRRAKAISMCLIPLVQAAISELVISGFESRHRHLHLVWGAILFCPGWTWFIGIAFCDVQCACSGTLQGSVDLCNPHPKNVQCIFQGLIRCQKVPKQCHNEPQAMASSSSKASMANEALGLIMEQTRQQMPSFPTCFFVFSIGLPRKSNGLFQSPLTQLRMPVRIAQLSRAQDALALLLGLNEA